jgi:cytochrome c-type biogenesis protein CcmE
MQKQQAQYLRFGIAIGVIVISLVYLAYTGVQQSKSYYVTIAELRQQSASGDSIYRQRLRVAGNVAPGSIRRHGSRVEFTLSEAGQTLPVIYSGMEAPPDTFKDDAQALAEGQFGRDGIFHANALQAKCASKYAPKQTPASAPPAQKS